MEAREKSLKEKRALKLTTTIVVVEFLSHMPITSFRMIVNVLKDRLSLDTIYAVYFSASSLAVVNSFMNPLIYSVRLRQFRVAFIELLLKKNRAEAEQFEKKMFGSKNAAPIVETNQGGEREEENVNLVNQVNVDTDIEANQGGEREEENVNQVNANIDIEDLERNQRGEREEQNVNQLNADTDIEANCEH